MGKEIKTFHTYFLNDLKYILVIFCSIGIIGNSIDIPFLLKVEPLIILFNSISIFILLLILILHFKYNVSVKTCFIIGAYTLILNSMFSQFTTKFNTESLYIFMREALIIALIIAIAGIFINGKQAVILAVIFLVYYIIYAFYRKNSFLIENIIIITLIYAAFVSAIYYFTNALRKALHTLQTQAYQITEQNEHLNDVNTQLEEWHSKIEEQNKMLQTVTENLQQKTDQLNEKTKLLENLNETKDKFFSIISHDLKGPIGALSGLAEYMLYKFDSISEDQKQRILHKIIHSTDHIYELLINLLDWSRAQTHSIQIEPVSFNIKPRILKLVELLKSQANEKQIKIKCEIDNNCMIKADTMMFDTILRNIISNSIKYTNINGAINITAKKQNDQICIDVQDNGIGIELKLLDKLFKIDKKFSLKGTAGETGTGLGLIICKEFTEMNRGTLEVKSEAGLGTTFTLSFPADEKNINLI